MVGFLETNIYIFLEGEWVILDTSTLRLKSLTIYGSLEFDNSSLSSPLLLQACIILVDGGLLMAGIDESRPFVGQAIIRLIGSYRSIPEVVKQNVNCGNKALCKS